jgi:hypothetical protein
MTSTVTSKRKPQKKKAKRRRPHEAQTDWARWAHRKLDEACAERAAHPKA